MMLLKAVSTITSECFFVRSETRETSSTSSAFVMLPLVIAVPLSSGLPVSEMFTKRRGAVARALLIRLPVGAELVGLERANREADLPLGRRQLDDLHRIGLTDGEIDLLRRLAMLMRLVELRDVDQTFDAFVELDERAEVRHPHHLAFDRVADLMAREEVVPDVGGQLLEAERQALVLGVDVQHHRLDDVALLQHLGRMLDALAP